jgi:hypothetical protein
MEEILRRYKEGRDDPMGGWGALPEEPTETDRWNVDYWDRQYDAWEDYEYWDEWYKEWKKGTRLKDPNEWYYYKPRAEKIKNYDDAAWFRASRLPKGPYEARAREISQHGIGRVYMDPQLTGNLISLKVKFPPGFKHLTNKFGQAAKARTDAGYHISLAYKRDIENDPTLRQHVTSFLLKYFGRDKGRFFDLNNIRVTDGGTYELKGDDEFVKDAHALSQAGTKKQAHISLD